MAITDTTKIANRYGLNLNFYNASTWSESTPGDPVYTIDFANSVSIEITGDAVYATGGQAHKRIVAFNNAMEGTMTINTQIVTPGLLKLIANDSGTTAGTAVFKSVTNSKTYVVSGTTVWKDASGNTYAETVTAYKVTVRPTYNPSYSGDGDPQEITITCDLMEDDTNGISKFVQAEQ